MMEDVIQFNLDEKTCDIIDYDTSSTISCSIATIEWLPKNQCGLYSSCPMSKFNLQVIGSI